MDGGSGPKHYSSSNSRSTSSSSHNEGVSPQGQRDQQKVSTAGGADHVLVVQEVGGTPAVQHELIVLPNRRRRRYDASGIHQMGGSGVTGTTTSNNGCRSSTGVVDAAGVLPISSDGISGEGGGSRGVGKRSGGSTRSTEKKGTAERRWRWFGFRWHDIGFMASFLQLIGATIFWVSGEGQRKGGGQ